MCGTLDVIRKIKGHVRSWWVDAETGFAVHLAGPSQICGEL